MLFPFFQVTRPPRLKAIKMLDRWFIINLRVPSSTMWRSFIFAVAGILYLVFAFFFSMDCTGRCSLDSGALHLRFDQENFQLLRTN